MKRIIILSIISIVFVLFGIMFYIEYDCFNRANYWNDRGFFVDTWEYQWQQCNYGVIP